MIRPPVEALGDPARVVETVLGCRPEDVAPRVVVTPFVPLSSFRRHAPEPLADLNPRFFFQGFTAAFEGVPVTVVHTGVGPTRVGDCLGALALTPARRVLFVGAVGGLGDDLALGDWFLPTAVADGEGYTRYVREGFGAVVAGAEPVPVPEPPGLGPFLEDRGGRVARGPVFTVGPITFESEENLRLLAARGYRAIEMELSAFYAAAAALGLEPACLTYVSDLPLRSSLWAEKTPAETEALRAAWRAAPRFALEWLCGQGEG
ncbi:phosphorylase family protein [Deferrisoma sp.]